MARKRTLFSKLTGQYFFALASVAVLIAGLIAILLTGWNRRLIMVFLCIGIVTAAASLLFYLMKTLPESRRYSHLTRRFRDGEIYQDYIRGIDGLFPYLKEDIDRLDALIDRQNIMQLSTKQAEFLALQNQINPHFLYNTLDSIRGDALAAGAQSIADITEALSTFFRYTITETRNLVTIGEELENVHNYFVIQQYRFGDKLTMVVDIKDNRDEILRMQCPKLFLQPIIENAIFHGLERRKDDGLLTISIEQADEDLHVDISDNGAGIPAEQLYALNKSLSRVSVGAIMEEPNGKKGGIALKNVCRRIKLLFGERYGIHISSIVGIGTKVEVVLPISFKETKP